MILGGAVRAIREARSASDERFKGSRFAIACGMSHGQLCNIEKGRRPASDDVIERVAEELAIPVDAISYIAAMEATA